MRTDFQKLAFPNLIAKSYACLSPNLVKLSCKTNNIYSADNCIVGSTKDIRIEISPTLFMESYSSVDISIMNVPS